MSAIDISTVANYVTSVDVYREYTDFTQASTEFYWETSCELCGGAGCSACSLSTQDGCFHVRAVPKTRDLAPLAKRIESSLRRLDPELQVAVAGVGVDLRPVGDGHRLGEDHQRPALEVRPGAALDVPRRDGDVEPLLQLEDQVQEEIDRVVEAVQDVLMAREQTSDIQMGESGNQ